MREKKGKKSNIVAIVQARIGSTKFPGKVLKEILGKPMLWHLINRVEKSKYIKKTIIAITMDKKDDIIEKFANKYHLGIYRGSENDIADRFYNAAKKYNADVIVRIWGDCPFVDPEIVDSMLKIFIDERLDYITNFNPPTFPRGFDLEIYSIKVLQEILDETDDPFYRGYPFEFVFQNGNQYKTRNYYNTEDLSKYYWTVDYKEDFDFVSKVYKELQNDDENIFHLKDILNFIKAKPEIVPNVRKKRNIEYYKALKLRKRDKNG